MKKKLILSIVLIAATAAFSQRGGILKNMPNNSGAKFQDTVYIDSTASAWSDVFWQDYGTEKAVMFQADDTSSVGIGSDSAAVKIELYQAYPRRGNTKQVILVKSRANPDSTSWPYSTDFVIDDSLDIKEMDTTALYAFTMVADTNLNGDTVNYYYSTVIDSAVTDSAEYIACKDFALAPLASPGIAFRFTGKAANKKAGAGSRWIVTVYQIDGQPVSVVKD